jgi:hypothetical protein
MATTLTLLAAIVLPAVIFQLKAMLATLALNPYILAFAALAVSVALLYDNFAEIKRITEDTFGEAGTGRIKRMNAEIQKLKTASSGSALDLGGQKALDEIAKLEKAVEKLETLRANKLRAELTDRKRLDDLEMSKARRDTDALANGSGSDAATKEIDKRATLLEKLNKQYLAGTITVASYYEQLRSLDTIIAKGAFANGKKDLEQYRQETEKIDLARINRDFNSNVISWLK